MKALKLVLLMVALLSVLIVAGCQEGYTSHSSTDNFAWEQGATGFWQPNVSYTHNSDSEYELSRR